MDQATVDRRAVEAHLEQVLASATFRGAERSRRLLRFIVEQSLQGHADRLKDYTLGAEALGRGTDFDPRIDPIARVEMSRLRSRLDVYYATEGAADDVRISIPKGGYVPAFERRPATTNATMSDGTGELRDAASAANAWPWSVFWLPLAAAVLAAFATWWLVRPAQTSTSPARLHAELTTPPTTDPASLALSPDGLHVVFVASDDGVPRLWIRELTHASVRPLPGTEHASLPFWRPDGRAIGFFAEGRVKAIDVQTRLVRTLSTAPVAAGAAWNRDDIIVHAIVPDGPLVRTTGGGALEPVTALAEGQTGHRGPVFLPDGRRFLFYAAGDPSVRGIHLGELGSLRVRRLIDADAPAVFAAPRHLLYVRGSTLFSQTFEPATMTLAGDPTTVAEHLAVEPGSGLAALSASATGTVVYRPGPVGARRQFIWFDRTGRELARIGSIEERGPSYASMDPQGRRLVLQRAAEGNTDIWVVDVERGTSVRFTTDPRADIAPIWSPLGDRIAYASQVDGVFELFEQSADRDRAEPRVLLRNGQVKQITDWSRDGRFLLYRSITIAPRADVDVWAVALHGDRTPFEVVRTAFEERDAQFSPDGNWIAYQSNESGAHEVYVQPFRREGERLRISANGGVHVRWRSDGRELFYVAPDGFLMAVPMAEANGRLQPGAPVPLFQTRIGAPHGAALPAYIVAPGGQRFLLDTLVEQQAAPIAFIMNWNPDGR